MRTLRLAVRQGMNGEGGTGYEAQPKVGFELYLSSDSCEKLSPSCSRSCSWCPQQMALPGFASLPRMLITATSQGQITS